MKKIFSGISALLLLLTSNSFAQTTKSYHITGQLKNIQAKKVYLVRTNESGQQLDSIDVVNNSYEFRGEIEDDNIAFLVNGRPFGTPKQMNIAQFWLAPGELKVINTDSFSNVSFSGSTANELYKKQIHDKASTYSARIRELTVKGQNARQEGDEAAMNAAAEEINKVKKALWDEVLAPFAKANPGSPLGLYVLKFYASMEMKLDTVKVQQVRPVFNGLSAAVRESKSGKAFDEKLVAVERTRIGQEAMDFTQNDTAGNPLRLSSFRGKYVLIDFWASWCGPCLLQSPYLVNAYAKFHPKGFEIIGVSLDSKNDREKWLAAIYFNRLLWKQVSDLQQFQNAIAKAYGINFIPQNFLIDPQGKIIARDLTNDGLENKLKEVYTN